MIPRRHMHSWECCHYVFLVFVFVFCFFFANCKSWYQLKKWIRKGFNISLCYKIYYYSMVLFYPIVRYRNWRCYNSICSNCTNPLNYMTVRACWKRISVYILAVFPKVRWIVRHAESAEVTRPSVFAGKIWVGIVKKNHAQDRLSGEKFKFLSISKHSSLVKHGVVWLNVKTYQTDCPVKNINFRVDWDMSGENRFGPINFRLAFDWMSGKCLPLWVWLNFWFDCRFPRLKHS